MNWRVRLAKFYIKQVNKLSFLNGSGVKTLRHIKERQDRDSQDTFNKTRPPKGIKTNFIYFRLFEIYKIENVNMLLEGLEKLFPNFNNNFIGGDSYKKFIQNSTGITSGEWLNIGYIFKDNKKGYAGQNHRELKELPRFVDSIHIELHKILPSIFVLTFDVNLNDNATQKINELQSSLYSSEIRFRKIIPSGVLGGGYSEKPCEHVMKQEIENWISNLQFQVEKCLRVFFTGYFLSEKSQSKGNLPSVSVFGIKGIPKNVLNITEWLINSGNWLESFGFDSLQFNSFTNGKLIFVRNWSRSEDNTKSRYRLIVAWDSYLEPKIIEMYGNNEKIAISIKTQEDFLSTILPSIAISEMLSHFQFSFEEIRQNVLSFLKPNILNGFHLRKYIKLNDAVLQASVLYDRISKDFKIEKDYISRNLEKISDFSESRKSKKNKKSELNEYLIRQIEFKIEMLKEHVDFLFTWLSRYLALENLSMTFFLAIIALFLAMLSIFLSRNEFAQAINNLNILKPTP